MMQKLAALAALTGISAFCISSAQSQIAGSLPAAPVPAQQPEPLFATQNPSEVEKQLLRQWEKDLKARQERRIYVHPKSGELVAEPVTPEQKAVAAKMNKALDEDQTGLPAQVQPDGRLVVQLDKRFMETTYVTIDASGKKRTECGSFPHEHPHAAATEQSP